MNSTFITVLVVGILAVASPGPDFLIVTRNSLLYSKRVGLATAWGIAVGNIWWIAASVLGISLVVAKVTILFNILKWLGALYLIYIGLKALSAKKREVLSEVAGKERPALTPMRGFKMGLLTNLLNPKCALFFVSFFSLVISPTTPTFVQCLYGGEIMVIAVVWFSLLATVLSISKIKQVFTDFAHWFDRLTGAILVLFGVKVALTTSR